MTKSAGLLLNLLVSAIAFYFGFTILGVLFLAGIFLSVSSLLVKREKTQEEERQVLYKSGYLSYLVSILSSFVLFLCYDFQKITADLAVILMVAIPILVMPVMVWIVRLQKT